MEGYLTVRRTTGHQRFYFVLDRKAGTMTCWKDPNGGYVGTSSLYGGTVATVEDGEGRRFTITSKHGRKLVLRADTAAECSDWVRVVAELQAQPPRPPKAASGHEGGRGRDPAARDDLYCRPPPTITAETHEPRRPLRPTSVPASRLNTRRDTDTNLFLPAGEPAHLTLGFPQHHHQITRKPTPPPAVAPAFLRAAAPPPVVLPPPPPPPPMPAFQMPAPVPVFNPPVFRPAPVTTFRAAPMQCSFQPTVRTSWNFGGGG